MFLESPASAGTATTPKSRAEWLHDCRFVCPIWLYFRSQGWAERAARHAKYCPECKAAEGRAIVLLLTPETEDMALAWAMEESGVNCVTGEKIA